MPAEPLQAQQVLFHLKTMAAGAGALERSPSRLIFSHLNTERLTFTKDLSIRGEKKGTGCISAHRKVLFRAQRVTLVRAETYPCTHEAHISHCKENSIVSLR